MAHAATTIESARNLLFGAAMSLGLFSCHCPRVPDPQESSAAKDAAALASPGAEGVQPLAGGVVNLAIWSNYVSDETLARFKALTGIEVRMSNYSSNEELLAKLQAGATGIDVAVPSDYMISVMRNLELLTPLDKSKIPNLAGLNPAFLSKPFDSTNAYSLPYGWTLTGIAINRDLFKGKLTSWKDLLTSPELKGKMSLLDDVREALGAALRVNGKGINELDPKELSRGKATLLAARANVRSFTSEPRDMIVKGELAAAQMYSSDALQARRETGGKIEFIIPDEGATMAIDNLVIPKGAANAANAHALINFLLSPEANYAYVSTILAGAVVLKVTEMLPADLKQDPVLFPPADKLAKFEMVQDIGDATTLWDRIWTEVKVKGGG